MMKVKASPYTFPISGSLTPQNTALVLIDMQNDFCAKGGYVDKMGYPLPTKPIAPLRRVLQAFREKEFFVIHTREGHRPDLTDLPENKMLRSRAIGAEIGSFGPLGRILGKYGVDVAFLMIVASSR